MSFSRWLLLPLLCIANFKISIQYILVPPAELQGGRSDGQCLTGLVLADSEYKESVQLKSYNRSCLCFFEIVCQLRQQAASQCPKVNELSFDCSTASKNSTNATKGRLKIFYPSPTRCQSHKDAECIREHFLSLKRFFISHIDQITESASDDKQGARLVKILLRIWDAGLYSLVHREVGGKGRVRIHDEHSWLPLVVALLLIVFSVLLFLGFFIFYTFSKDGQEEAAGEEEEAFVGS